MRSAATDADNFVALHSGPECKTSEVIADGSSLEQSASRETPLLAALGQVDEEGTGEQDWEHVLASTSGSIDGPLPSDLFGSALSTQGSFETGETGAAQQIGPQGAPAAAAAAAFKSPTLFKSAFTGKLWHSQDLNAGAQK